MFAELPQSPVRMPPKSVLDADSVTCLAKQLSSVKIEDQSEEKAKRSPRLNTEVEKTVKQACEAVEQLSIEEKKDEVRVESQDEQLQPQSDQSNAKYTEPTAEETSDESPLRVLTWDDVCPPGDRIDKIAEASYAEVYRVTNERGVSIIKVIRLPSPIKAQTKAQVRSGLVDEEPHPETDVQGELQISEWLADIPGFVVYKERYIVQGKASRQLLETHQAFQKRMKRQDPDRAQFYPSPSRYLEGTRFLVVELGDAGIALEDFDLNQESQLWDIFFLEAIALARAEDLVMFEVCFEQKSMDVFGIEVANRPSTAISMRGISVSNKSELREQEKHDRKVILAIRVLILPSWTMVCLGPRICLWILQSQLRSTWKRISASSPAHTLHNARYTAKCDHFFYGRTESVYRPKLTTYLMLKESMARYPGMRTLHIPMCSGSPTFTGIWSIILSAQRRSS